MALNKLSKKISLKLFNRRKPLEMVLFDKLFSKFILNTKNTKNFIEEFHDKGYAKLELDVKREVDIISKNFSTSDFISGNKYHKLIEPNNNTIEAIKNILNNKLNDTKYLLEKYYNSKIFPAYVSIARNLHFKKNKISDEFFANCFHQDGYVLTHFKIFFNLMDITENDGPLRVISKKKNGKFIKKTKYKDRYDYQEISDENEFVHKNIGKKGDTIIFDPTQCLHSATIPAKGHHRDNLAITFVCLPNNEGIKKDLLKNLDIFKYENNDLIRFAKPNGFINSLKLFYKYL